MQTDHPPTRGLILAGGLARRVGGGDKALLKIGGDAILDRVIARFGPQCTGLLINANGDPARFGRFGLPVVAEWPDKPVDPFFNVNQPEDLANAEALAAQYRDA